MLGSFYPGFMYGGASGWLGLVELLEVNGMTSGTTSSAATLQRFAELSLENLSVLSEIYGLDMSGSSELVVDNHSVTIGSASTTIAVVRNLITGSILVSTEESPTTLTKLSQLGINNLLSSVSFTPIELLRFVELSVDGHSVKTIVQGVTLGVVRNLTTDNLMVVVADDALEIDRFINVHPNSLSLVTATSEPSLVAEILLGVASQSLSVLAGSPYMAAGRSMSIDDMSLLQEISSTLAQIGYPVFGIGSDEIYALGTIPEGEYNIATLNNNEIYEVVEHDGI